MLYYIELCDKYTGLTNQLNNLVSAIVKCIQEKISILVVGKFLMQIYTNNYCPISKILCLNTLNHFLRERYRLTLIDSYNISKKDRRFLHRLKIGDSQLQTTSFATEIFKKIRFVPSLAIPAFQFVKTTLSQSNSSIMNVIHLRMEDDAIIHWSKINDMTPEDFQRALTNKYIQLIQQHIVDKSQMTVILSASLNNEVVSYLRNNGYAFSFLKKTDDVTGNSNSKREVNAVLDMIIGKQCNGIFIGCGGSTFSDLLCKLMPENIPKYLFDINHMS